MSFRNVLFFFFTCSSSLVFSQLAVFPTGREHVQRVAKDYSNARSKTHTLTLPFWDDFSTPTGLTPDVEKWADGSKVWVNNGMAIDAPTLNVATFDGLDSSGLAYNPTEVLVTGYTDELTSAPIDLSLASVSLEERPTVFLSFFYQWQGNGEAPDRDDYIQLDFLTEAGTWEMIMTIYPEDTFDRNVFYEQVIQVSGDRFFHDLFQFRFRSFGRQSGPYDTWNLDYIYLNKNRSASDTSYPERAAASAPTPLFGVYNSIPYKHFLANNLLTKVKFDVQNLKQSTTPVSINYRATAFFTTYLPDDTTSYSTTLVASEGVKGTSGIMFPLERTTVEVSALPDPNDPLQFDPNATGVDVTLKMKVISSDSIDDDRNKFLPFNLQVNDTVSATYHLRDFYAYDDGVAEYAAGLVEPGSLAAYQFEKIISQSDKLVGFDIHFVPYGVTNNQTITFYVFRDDNGKPGTILETVPSQLLQKKGLNEFVSVRWNPVTLIDQQRFYIGWKQPVEGKALVGLDISNDTGDRMFVNTSSSWYQNQAVRGSLMIRPVFGEGEVLVGTDEKTDFGIYPNPSKGTFYIEGPFDDLRIFSSTGSPVAFQSEKESTKTLVKVQASAGLFLARIVRAGKIITQKIIVTE